MKNVVTKCLLVLIMLLLSGCAREPDPVVPTEQGGSCRDSIELSTGFYYRNGNLLMRQQPGELAFSPLCADPACTHDGPDCAAWFENPGSALSDLGWFHDRIWLVVKEQNTNTCYSVDPISGARSREFVLPQAEPAGTRAHGDVGCRFTESYLAVFQAPGRSVPVEEGMERLFVVKLDDHTVTEPFAEILEEQIHGTYPQILNDGQVLGDKLYFSASFPTQNIDPMGETDTVFRAVILDLKKGSFEIIRDWDEQQWCTDGKVLLYYNQANRTLCTWDLENKTESATPLPDFLKDSDAFITSYDSEYLYLIEFPQTIFDDSNLYIFSRDYTLLASLVLPAERTLAYDTEQRLYIKQPDGPIEFYLDKADIQSGNVELKPIP